MICLHNSSTMLKEILKQMVWCSLSHTVWQKKTQLPKWEGDVAKCWGLQFHKFLPYATTPQMLENREPWDRNLPALRPKIAYLRTCFLLRWCRFPQFFSCVSGPWTLFFTSCGAGYIIACFGAEETIVKETLGESNSATQSFKRFLW